MYMGLEDRNFFLKDASSSWPGVAEFMPLPWGCDSGDIEINSKGLSQRKGIMLDADWQFISSRNFRPITMFRSCTTPICARTPASRRDPFGVYFRTSLNYEPRVAVDAVALARG
jgi:hypothetical protein